MTGAASDLVRAQSKESARTYNQSHRLRPYTPGRRRVSIYVSWSFPGEANRDLTIMDNRFSTMTEVRRAEWPRWEGREWASPTRFQQGIAGGLELFFRSWTRFQKIVEEATSHAVPVFQRVDQAGFGLPLDERVLSDTDTLLVFGLDHTVTEQTADPAEIEAVRRFLSREGTCLVLGPHHDVGASDDMNVRAQEYNHHGDPLVPRQQRFGGYLRSLMKGLDVPIENRFGLRPAPSKDSGRPAPLSANRDLDTHGWLEGVTTFSSHMHLPHYALTRDDPKSIRVLATQPIDLSRPHPFIEAGNREFNALVWMSPGGSRGGDILMVDSTVFSTLFGMDESLDRFWKNLASKK